MINIDPQQAVIQSIIFNIALQLANTTMIYHNFWCLSRDRISTHKSSRSLTLKKIDLIKKSVELLWIEILSQDKHQNDP